MSSEQMSAGVIMQLSRLVKLTRLLTVSHVEANQPNIPKPYLLNLQLLQKEREERHGIISVMD